MIQSFTPKAAIAWSRVFALAGMQGSIILSWVMYRLYLPDLFAQVGLAQSVVGTVLLFEVAIAFVLEPLMGYGSDQLRYWTGTRFPLILGAVLLTAVMFFALPPIARLGLIAQSILPLAAVIWAMAMATFRSPILVMLAQCAIASDLPYAAGVLMAVGALAGRLIPLANDFWLSCGVGITFAIGSIVLLIAIAVLRQTLPPPVSPLPPSATTPPQINPRHLVITLLRMVTVAIGVVWSGALFNALIAALYAGVDQTPWLNAYPVQVGIVSAISCLVAAAFGQRFGMRRVVTIATAIAIAAFLGRSVSGTLAIGSLLTLAIVVVQNVINVGVIPLAIEIAPAGFGGVAIGMYFGTLGLAGNMFDPLFGDLSGVSPLGLAQAGAVAIALVTLGFGWGLWRNAPASPS
jgi:hypothetical protein